MMRYLLIRIFVGGCAVSIPSDPIVSDDLSRNRRIYQSIELSIPCSASRFTTSLTTRELRVGSLSSK